MGDTGSLAIGAGLAALCLQMNLQLLLPVIGGLFVIVTLSVVIQVISYRVFGRRVFRMAPLHHHFELAGWPETTVIVRFWILAGLCLGSGARALLRRLPLCADVDPLRRPVTEIPRTRAAVRQAGGMQAEQARTTERATEHSARRAKGRAWQSWVAQMMSPHARAATPVRRSSRPECPHFRRARAVRRRARDGAVGVGVDLAQPGRIGLDDLRAPGALDGDRPHRVRGDNADSITSTGAG